LLRRFAQSHFPGLTHMLMNERICSTCQMTALCLGASLMALGTAGTGLGAGEADGLWTHVRRIAVIFNWLPALGKQQRVRSAADAELIAEDACILHGATPHDETQHDMLPHGPMRHVAHL
jgi:hypothetical protein